MPRPVEIIYSQKPGNTNIFILADIPTHNPMILNNFLKKIRMEQYLLSVQIIEINMK
jgi:hypothetical protein